MRRGLEPLTVGHAQPPSQSPVITAEDQALALEAAAVAFNARGGANGHCIQVVTCDEQADPNQALDCMRTLDAAGVAVTINDASLDARARGRRGLAGAGIPRFAISAATPDLSTRTATRSTPAASARRWSCRRRLVDQGITSIASIRVDLPAASAIIGLFEDIYGDEGAEFVADIPVPAGTTDYSQFVLGAEEAGAEGVVVPLGGQEAIQVLRAAQQLGSDLVFSTSLGTLPYADLAELGDFADQIILNGSTPPATADDPAVQVAGRRPRGVRRGRARSPSASSRTAMHSWIGLYALLDIIRTAETEDFSRENLTTLIEASGPDRHARAHRPTGRPTRTTPGTFPRTGNGYYSFWRWDPDASFDGARRQPGEAGETDFNDLLCGSPLGAPPDTC